MVSQIKVNEIIKQSGSTITLGESGTTINIPSGATIANSGTATGFAESEVSFKITQNSNQNVSTATTTVVVFDSTTNGFDQGSNFNTSTYKFTAPSAGRYFFHSSVILEYGNAAGEYGNLTFFVNGSDRQAAMRQVVDGDPTLGSNLQLSSILDLSASDTVEVKIYHTQGGTQAIDSNEDFTYFMGYKIT